MATVTEPAKEYLSHYLALKSPIDFDLQYIVDPNTVSIILDIGACEGEDSIRYATKFPKAIIYSFEALPDNQDIIENNLTQFRLDKRVHLQKFALSDSKGEAKFYVSSSSEKIISNKSSSLLSPKEVKDLYSNISFEKEINVSTVPLDEFFPPSTSSTVHLIHMDVQGAELKVLKGGIELLKKTKAIWLEVAIREIYEGQCLEKDVDKFMKEQGFVSVKRWIFHVYGDKLYLNTRYFPIWQLYSLKFLNIGLFWAERANRVFRKVKRRITNSIK